MKSNIYKFFKSKLIFGKYSIKKLISQSSYSEVYLGTDVQNGKKYVFKIAKNEKDNSILQNESYALLNLKGPGIPSVISFGISFKYGVLVENLLGKSIRDIWQEKNKKFNLKDTCIFAIQAISLLEYIHSKNYVHRDIKPDNFLVGNPDNSQLYLIDFENAGKFRSSRTGKHLKNIKNTSIFGSLLYLSKNSFKGNIQTRKDDLESLGLVIIYLHMGSLPWSEVKAVDIHQAFDKLLEIRNIISNEDICKGMPYEMNIYMKYIDNLKYDECPDYKYLQKLFLNILKQIGVNEEQLLFSWVDKTKINSFKKSSSKSKSKNKSAKKIFRDLFEKNSIKVDLSQNLKNAQTSDKKENLAHITNNTYINESLEDKNVSLIKNITPNNINIKHKNMFINDQDINTEKIDDIKEKTKNNQNLDINNITLKNQLIISPKKINYKRIQEIPNNKRKIRKKIKNNVTNNINKEIINNDISRNIFKTYNSNSKIQVNSNSNNKISNYINIMNYNINNNSNIYIYSSIINNNNNESKVLGKIEKNNTINIDGVNNINNNINYIKKIEFNTLTNERVPNTIKNYNFYPKIYKPISSLLFPSNINTNQITSYSIKYNNNDEIKRKLTQLDTASKSITTETKLKIKNYHIWKKNSFPIPKMYKSFDLKKYGFTDIKVKNP